MLDVMLGVILGVIFDVISEAVVGAVTVRLMRFVRAQLPVENFRASLGFRAISDVVAVRTEGDFKSGRF